MDPLMELATTLLDAVRQNPFATAFLASIARNLTGFLWKKAKGESISYNKKEFAATLVKLEVAIPAVAVFLPTEQAAAVVVIADILGSWANKLRNIEIE